MTFDLPIGPLAALACEKVDSIRSMASVLPLKQRAVVLGLCEVVELLCDALKRHVHAEDGQASIRDLPATDPPKVGPPA